MAAAETIQAYLQATRSLFDWPTGSDESLCERRKWEQPSHPTADLQLAAFEKVIVAKGAQKTVELTIPPRQMACVSRKLLYLILLTRVLRVSPAWSCKRSTEVAAQCGCQGAAQRLDDALHLPRRRLGE